MSAHGLIPICCWVGTRRILGINSAIAVKSEPSILGARVEKLDARLHILRTDSNGATHPKRLSNSLASPLLFPRHGYTMKPSNLSALSVSLGVHLLQVVRTSSGMSNCSETWLPWALGLAPSCPAGPCGPGSPRSPYRPLVLEHHRAGLFLRPRNPSAHRPIFRLHR